MKRVLCVAVLWGIVGVAGLASAATSVSENSFHTDPVAALPLELSVDSHKYAYMIKGRRESNTILYLDGEAERFAGHRRLPGARPFDRAPKFLRFPAYRSHYRHYVSNSPLSYLYYRYRARSRY